MIFKIIRSYYVKYTLWICNNKDICEKQFGSQADRFAEHAILESLDSIPNVVENVI